jgi:hypothetical protein
LAVASVASTKSVLLLHLPLVLEPLGASRGATRERERERKREREIAELQAEGETVGGASNGRMPRARTTPVTSPLKHKWSMQRARGHECMPLVTNPLTHIYCSFATYFFV